MKRAIVTAAGMLALWAAPAQALPDLTISMPERPYPGQYAPVYLDAFQEPGKLLYRFDALIHNEGTTLDLYRDPDGSVHQALWPEGRPTVPQDADERPPPSLETPLAGAGAAIEYVVEETHDHFHFFTAARYELAVPGAPPRVSGKIGFCMFDSFDLPSATAEPEYFPASQPWCHESRLEAGFVRMGLSPGKADRYTSQREFQYVDVTGLAPGGYVLRGIANPEGHVREADLVPDVTEVVRTVPGVIADAAALAAAAGAAASVDVVARAVAPEIPARRSGACMPRAALDGCYLRITAATPLTYAVASGPQHGTASFDGARLTYVPAAGFSGTDRLTYTATDGRGLVSAPATVTVDVSSPPPPAAAGASAAPRRLLKIGRVRAAGRRALAVRLLCRLAAAGPCSGTLEARIAGRRAGRTRFGSLPTGRRRTVVLRLRRAHAGRRVVLRAAVSDPAGAGAPARRVTETKIVAR